jgi:6-phosphogluconolactonase (cycloisomerase 2 family)
LSTVALPITANSKTLQSFKYIMAGSGPDPSRQEAPHPHQALLDPTGAFILVPDLGADFLRIYSVNKNTGFLTSCANVTVAAGSGPRHAEFWAPASGLEGLKLFLGNELSNTASAFAVTYPQRDGNCLNLTLTQTGTPYPSSRTVKQGQKVGEVRVKVLCFSNSKLQD